MLALFKNDNYVTITLPNHEKSYTFQTRDKHEILFRRISTWLINNRFITKNIIDLGAWIGDNSIPWAKNISGIVYAIDPSDRNCNFINNVCEINNISNVTTFQTAISDKEEVLFTHQYLDHCTFIEGGHTAVNATSLDILFKDGKIKDVDYVHLDVEGMEYKVSKGMSELINTYHPIISFEQHLEIDNILEMVTYLKSKNYSIHMINETLPGCRPDCRNFLAFYNIDKYSGIIPEISLYFGINDLFIPF